MIKENRFRNILAAGLLAAMPFAIISGARADEPKKEEAKAPEEPKVTLNWLIDTYYQYGFGHAPAGTTLAGRSFDVKSDQFALNLGEVRIGKKPGKDQLGYQAVLTLGKSADLVHATEPGGVNTYKYLQELYGTYVTTGKTPITVDFGKFVTGHGMEVIESSSNDNYSRSLLFNYAIPFYHTGIRATANLTPTLTGQLQIVNGWNSVEDDNGGKSLGLQFVWTPNPKWAWTLNWMGGDESTAAGLPRNLNVQLVDLVGVWNLNSKLKLGINADYASASKKGVTGGNWSGHALYARYQTTPKIAWVVRGEHFEDSNGLRSGTAQNLNEVTLTFEHATLPNLLHRLEFRHDHAGTKFFTGGGGASKNQDTLTFSQVVKF